MLRSVMSMLISALRGAISFTASAPSAAVRIRYPFFKSMAAATSRIRVSSSTIRDQLSVAAGGDGMGGVRVIGICLDVCRGQVNAKGGAPLNIGFQVDEALVILNDAADRRQPETGSLARLLRRVEGLPDVLPHLGRYAHSGCPQPAAPPRSRPQPL